MHVLFLVEIRRLQVLICPHCERHERGIIQTLSASDAQAERVGFACGETGDGLKFACKS